MSYVSASRGFRSGGFNGRNTTPLRRSPSSRRRSGAYEIGLKTETQDRRLG